VAAAPLVEIFASIQGEGRFVGVPMAFVRTARCPIRCLYCDTPQSYRAPAACAVRGGDRRSTAGSRDGSEPNPVAAGRAAELVQRVAGPEVRRVSVTGGEPLLYPDFVLALGRSLAPARLHLETAALDPEALRACLPAVHHLSADYKLPGTLARGDFRAQHISCVELAAAAGCSVDVKLVLTNAVSDGAFARALDDLGGVRTHIVLVLQPVTPFGGVAEPLAAPRRDAFLAAALARGFDVRVLPQLHPVLGCR
jgi:organic radical activating enzyme